MSTVYRNADRCISKDWSARKERRPLIHSSVGVCVCPAYQQEQHEVTADSCPGPLKATSVNASKVSCRTLRVFLTLFVFL